MIVEVVCLASGFAGGFALARVSRRQVRATDAAAKVVDTPAYVTSIGSGPRIVNGKDAFAFAPPSTLPTVGGPTYRIVAESGAVLTETTDAVSAVKSWRTLKDNTRTEVWMFLQDALIRDRLGRTH